MRVLFRDLQVQSHYERHGWAKVDLLTQEEVSHLTDGFAMVNHYFSNGFDTTATMTDSKVKLLAKELIRPIFIEKVKRIFSNCNLLAESFLSKGYGNYPLPLHQDWSFVEEDKGFTSVVIWSPLVDVTPRNGTIMVVPNTHRLPISPRLACVDDHPYGAFQSVLKQHAQSISATAGEAVIWDSSLFHGSHPNLTSDLRPVAAALVVPSEARTVLYYRGEDGLIDMHASSDEFMLNNPILTARPSDVLQSFRILSFGDPEQHLCNVLGLEKPLLDHQCERQQQAIPVFQKESTRLSSRYRRLFSKIIRFAAQGK